MSRHRRDFFLQTQQLTYFFNILAHNRNPAPVSSCVLQSASHQLLLVSTSSMHQSALALCGVKSPGLDLIED